MTERRVQASWVAIAAVALLILLKLVVGLATSSVSILSQGVDSLTDLIAAGIAFYSIQRSLESPDQMHSYGHSRYENLSSVVVGLIIIFASLVILWEALRRLILGGEVEAIGLGIVTMAVSVVVSLLVSVYLMRTAKEEASMSLEADATYLRVDVYTNLGVLAGLVLISLTGLVIIDPLVAIAISGLSMYTAVRLVRKASSGLLDERISPQEEGAVREVLASHASRFRAFHALKTRRGGSQNYIELHLQVKGDMMVQEAHDLADHLEKEISARLPKTIVTIHIEPEGFSD